MFRLSQWLTFHLAFLLLAGWAQAQGTKTGPTAVGDHGVVLATAIDAAPGKLKDTIKVSDTKNYVYRSRIISLGKDRGVSYCFDTEHMRVAGVWVGKPVTYVAGKNMGPAVDGTMVFGTQPGPGWSHKGQWKDPREVPEGPLPRDWARYDGVYLHGNRAVLAYTVGDCTVLESPDVQQAGSQLIITRTLNLGPSAVPMSLLVCEEGKGIAELQGKPNAAGAYDTLISLPVGKEVLVAGVVGAPEGTSWQPGDGRVILSLPALPKGASLRLALARMDAGKDAHILKAALKAPVEDLTPLTKGGPARWTQVFQTQGTPSPDTKSPYVLDTIDLPADNPWKATIRFGGMDFFPDGRAALCTWDGDVWVVSGLQGKLDAVKWKRFAAGLQQPLGLKIVDGVIYTAGRDQVTRLVDLNNDGEADFLQNLNNEPGLTLQRHEFVMDLQTDSQGNFYFCRSGHYVLSKKRENCCVYRMSPDGRKLEVMARGFREPNGMSIGPDGTMTVSDNEGNGVPQTPVYHLQPGKFYGFMPGTGGGYKLSEPPIVWLPKNVDRSAGSQIWAPKDQWGPLGGQLLHTSYGNCALFSLLIDKKAEPWQGAAWKFPMAFNSGIMRGRFSPTDGQLYVCGLRGWDTSATKDGQLARIRFTGSKAPIPVGLALGKKSISVTFSAPLDREAAEDDQNWGGEWSASKDKKGKEELPIEAVKLSQDGRTVTVELERMVPVMNYTLQYDLKGADGSSSKGALNGTIHKVP